MDYHVFLTSVHRQLAPSTYLEVGIRNGGSLAIAKCRAVGIDPAYAVTAQLDGNIALLRTTSDEYFSRPDPLVVTGGRPLDLVFIDGLHLFEFALRDLINTERHCTTRSVIIFDDVLPRTVDEAARVRHTVAWTGDVYPILEVLSRYRPELTVLPVGTTPTGLLMLLGLDPANTVLADNYDAIVNEYRRADPQPVPAGVMDRLGVVPPERVLDSGVLGVLAATDSSSTAEQVQSALARPLTERLGAAFTIATVD